LQSRSKQLLGAVAGGWMPLLGYDEKGHVIRLGAAGVIRLGAAGNSMGQVLVPLPF